MFCSVTTEKSDALDPARIISIGFSASARLLTVVTTETVGDRMRIIRARRATRSEHVERASAYGSSSRRPGDADRRASRRKPFAKAAGVITRELHVVVLRAGVESAHLSTASFARNAGP